MPLINPGPFKPFVAVLPSLTQLACDTRKSVFSHAHTPMDKNLTRTGKNIPISTYFSSKMFVIPYFLVSWSKRRKIES